MQAVLTIKKIKIMRSKKIILTTIAIAVMAGGWYGYSEYNRKPKDLDKVKPHASMDASILIQKFEADESGANAAFLDKIIAVKGKVKAVEKNDKGFYTVIIGDEESMSSVRCAVDADHHQDMASLTAGMLVTMKGACTGFNADELLGSDVILNRCVLAD